MPDMANAHEYLCDMVVSQHGGRPIGIVSVCSAHPLVLEAAVEKARDDDSFLLIESTSNQVNQFGGYTGVVPRDFARSIEALVHEAGLAPGKVLLGGDHLGPYPWRSESADRAMARAATLIQDCVAAGYTKIHIDVSMHLGDDPGDSREALDPRVVAERAADLCAVAEKTSCDAKPKHGTAAPVYVIGTEVPIPGGTRGEEAAPQVTDAADFLETVDLCQAAFRRQGLESAWERVIAVVVQPGVEFGDQTIHPYDRRSARGLVNALQSQPSLVFEAHSTDYQSAATLRAMVEDGFGILKVGPALTFALREALFLLAEMEGVLSRYFGALVLSDIPRVLETAMLADTTHWSGYYHGTSAEISFARMFSFSDRCRYYWTVKEVRAAVDRLVQNLHSVTIPDSLISQYLPNQYLQIRSGVLPRDPAAIVKSRIAEVLQAYASAVGGPT